MENRLSPLSTKTGVQRIQRVSPVHGEDGSRSMTFCYRTPDDAPDQVEARRVLRATTRAAVLLPTVLGIGVVSSAA